MKFSTKITSEADLPILPADLFTWFNLTTSASVEEIDLAYFEKLNDGDLSKKNRTAWKILRDPFYRDAYHHFQSLAKIVEAGFFDDEISIEKIRLFSDQHRHLLSTPFHKIKITSSLDKSKKKVTCVAEHRRLRAFASRAFSHDGSCQKGSRIKRIYSHRRIYFTVS